MERERKSSGLGGMSEGLRQQLGKTKSKVSILDQGAVEIHKSVKAFSQMIAHGVGPWWLGWCSGGTSPPSVVPEELRDYSSGCASSPAETSGPLIGATSKHRGFNI